MNIAEIESSLRDLAEAPFDAGSFIYRFMEIYDAPKSTVTKLRQAKINGADLLPDGDLIWKQKLFFRVALPGRAADAVDVMAADPNVRKLAPRFLIATDGEEVYALDTKADQTRDVPFAKLNDAFDFFLMVFILKDIAAEFHAPLPSSSLESGRPNRMTPGTPRSNAERASSTTRSTLKREMPGMEGMGCLMPLPGSTNRG